MMNTSESENKQAPFSHGPLPHPLHPNEFEPPEYPEGFHLVRGLEVPMITRRSTYPFGDMRLHDAIIFDTERQLKAALQAARTFRKHSPKFRVSGRKISRGKYTGKFAIIRVA
ncbi:MAG TPA: hypothetical protein VFH87_01665 [Candidatus Udaeobacter sp.]|nr:hypothetical protein [Candidatus Udaeobacter sp.]